MDIIKRAMLLEGNAVVTVLDMTETVRAAAAAHNLPLLSADILGQSLVLTAYLGIGLKNKTDKLNVIIDGGGPVGKIITAAEDGTVRGFLETPVASESEYSRFDLAAAVGRNGSFSVTMDLGLKQPFVGKTPMMTGNLGLDFAFYLLQSEQKRTAVALTGDITKRCGGIIIEPMPMCSEEALVMIEDTALILSDFGPVLAEKCPEEIINFYFKHFAPEQLDDSFVRWDCNCKEKTDRVILGIGRQEAGRFLAEDGRITVKCDFCGRRYVYLDRDIKKLFGN